MDPTPPAPVATLVTSIEQAFPVEPRPQDDRLAGHACRECDDLRAVLRGKRWTDLLDATIDENFDKLPLLTPEAFCYYVPAFIRRAVRSPVESGLGLSLVLEFTVYSLCRSNTRPADARWLDRVGRFTPEQERVIVRFLRWVVRTIDEYGVDDIEVEDARWGLATYWNARVRKSPRREPIGC